MDTHLVRALLNPTRIRILDAVAEGPASAPQLAAALEKSLGLVSYHLGVLRETGCIEPVEGERGGDELERTYELAPHATPTRRLTRPQMAPPALGHPSAAALRSIVERGSGGALAAGTLGGREEDHLSCSSIVLDRQGWLEVTAAIGSALDRVSVAHEESTRRLADTDEEGIAATVAVAHFGSAPAA